MAIGADNDVVGGIVLESSERQRGNADCRGERAGRTAEQKQRGVPGLLDLILGRQTFARWLTERQLGKVLTEMPIVEGRRALVAGGTPQGSDQLVLERFRPTSIISVNINGAAAPDVVVDLEENWPFSDNTFDLVVACFVLEHVRDAKHFISECGRVTRQKGVLVLVYPFIYQKHGAPKDFARFTDTWTSNMLVESGFRPAKIVPVGGQPFVAAVSLLWPVVGFVGLGAFVGGFAIVLDRMLEIAVRLSGRGKPLLDAYAVNYVVIAEKDRREE